jgi:prophage regulatory protein
MPKQNTISNTTETFLSRKELPAIVKASRSSIINWENAGKFPKPIPIGVRSVRYRLSEIQQWMADPKSWAQKDEVSL